MTSKLRRVSQACDNCSARRVRCRPSDTDNPRRCQHCVDFGEECTYNRPQRKRGARKGRRASSHSARVLDSPVSAHGPPLVSSTASDKPKWTPLPIDQALAVDLTEIFFEVVYPVFPLFHQSSVIRRVSRGEHMTDRPFYASVMAMCALSSARARDGAIYSQRCKRQSLTDPSSEQLFDAARAALEVDATTRVSLDYMRAAVLLSITAIQYGNDRLMHFFLGIYHTYVATEGLHDEANWPAGLSVIETQERRRLFWSAYTLDVFTSIVWNGTVRSREASANVAYPEPMDDESPAERNGPHRVKTPRAHWMVGWNFITDMYRILEHAVDHLRRARIPLRHPTTVDHLLDGHALSKDAVVTHVFRKYNDLPPEFKIISDITFDLDQDLYGFQAANIAATLQLVRMVYFTNDNATTLEDRCVVAGQVINGFANVPPAYLRAISSPLQHHLAEIGSMLGAAFRHSMTESSYRTVRGVLLNFASLLESLESNLLCSTGTSAKLKRQVTAADEYMAAQRAAATTGMSTQQRMAFVPRHSATPPVDVRNSSTTPTLPLLTDDNKDSPQYQFPPELFEDFSWTWGFDMQTLQQM